MLCLLGVVCSLRIPTQVFIYQDFLPGSGFKEKETRESKLNEAFGVRNITYCTPEVAKGCCHRPAHSLCCNVWKRHPECWLFYSQLTGQNGFHFSCIFLENVHGGGGGKNSFGIFGRGQKYNLAFVWWECGKFQFPSICAGESKLNLEAPFPGSGPRGWDACLGLSCPGKSASHVRKFQSNFSFLPEPPGSWTPAMENSLSWSIHSPRKEGIANSGEPRQLVHSLGTGGVSAHGRRSDWVRVCVLIAVVTQGGTTDRNSGSWTPGSSDLRC